MAKKRKAKKTKIKRKRKATLKSAPLVRSAFISLLFQMRHWNVPIASKMQMLRCRASLVD
jgi:hypothetical protein